MPLTAISARRMLTGPNQARGKLTLVIKNNHENELKVIYLEAMPWLLQFYLHTLRIHSDGRRRGTWDHS
jgi:phosphatidylinositol glycan class T